MKNDKNYLKEYFEDVYNKYHNILPIPENLSEKITNTTYAVILTFEISTRGKSEASNTSKRLIHLNLTVGIGPDQIFYNARLGSDYKFVALFSDESEELKKYFTFYKTRPFTYGGYAISHGRESVSRILQAVDNEMKQLEKYLSENNLSLNFLYSTL